MSAPCPECLGCGWRPYCVETVEGGEEWAWELCPECPSEALIRQRQWEDAEARIVELAFSLNPGGNHRLAALLATAAVIAREEVAALREGVSR